MDTPVKNRIPSNNCSISKLEDSPVFNYISNLSPIEPIKSAHNDHSFNSLSYSSPPPVFTSPELNLQKQSRFKIRRHHSLDSSSKSLFSSTQIGNEESNVAVEARNTCVRKQEDAGECSIEPSQDNSESAIKVPQALKHDSDGPDSNRPRCNNIEMNALRETSDVINSHECPTDGETDLRKLCWAEKHKEAEGCDGMTLISDNLSNFSLSLDEEHSLQQDHKTVDPGAISFVSSILNLPLDNLSSYQRRELDGSVSFCEHLQMGDLTGQTGEHCDVEEKNFMSSILSTPLADNCSNTEKDGSGTKCIQSITKQPCGISKRSLIFDGASNKNSKCDSSGSLTVSEQPSCMDASNKKQGIQLKVGSGYSSSVLPGIGLHLNALAASSNGKVIKCETSASEKQLSMPNFVYSCNSPISGQNDLTKCLTSSTMEGDIDSSDSEAKMKESSPQTLCCLEESEHNSPKRKRYKIDNVEGNGSCKRCNCKRSKCLKLYCECFAAGLYCIEPCSCQDCFNKPIHENIVLETRKLIESRNPLAFAPKVIRNIDAVPESRDSYNSTPASARHKQGCNCRKSGCLKKYCECFQGRVGCSVSCRCMGCKNTFGQRDGPDDRDNEERESEGCKNNKLDVVLEETMDVEKELPDAPKPHREIVRSSLQLPYTISGKISISSLPGSSLRLCTSQNVRTISNSSHHELKSEKQIHTISDDETNGDKNNNCTNACAQSSTSPNSNIRRSGRKLILRSIPHFPSLAPP